MNIEGYEHVVNLSREELQYNLENPFGDFELIIENDAMWHYMTTGQVLEGQTNGRTGTDNKEGTDHQS